MRSPCVLAVDIGSSSVRAALYDLAGRPVRGAWSQVAYERDVDDRGAVQVPFERVLDSLVGAVDGLVARIPSALPRVAAAGISCFLHSVAGLDRDGVPVTPLLTWADTTAADEADGLRAELDAGATWAETGAPLHPSYWPAKVRRIRSLAGGRAVRFGGAPELAWRALTGRLAADMSQVAGTGLLDRATGDWHRDLLAHLRLERDALPEIAPADAAAPLLGWAASRWPALAGVPWHAPWSDAVCGNVGLGGADGGLAALQVGTSGALRIIAEPMPGVERGLFAQRLADGRSLVGGQLSEGGGVVAAMAGLVGRSARTLDRDAATLAPDGHGLTMLPFLSGERSLGYHARAHGVIAGVTLGTSAAELHLATVEAIALRFAAIDRRLTLCLGAAPPIVASGGALKSSDLLAPALAAALGRSILRSGESEASARGAALLAAAAAGLVSDPGAVPHPPSTPVEPDAARVAAYRAAADRQEELYRRVFGEI